MKRIVPLIVLALMIAARAAEPSGEWRSLFDGKSLDGWKASDEPGTFSVVNGEIIVHGNRSHLFYDGPVSNHDFRNFEVKADVLTKPGSNSGFYFHTRWQEKGWPDAGFEVQVNNSHKDPKRTAGLYAIKDNYDAVAKDDEWFTLTIRVEGRHVVTKVNGKVVTDYTEPVDYKPSPSHAHRGIDDGTLAIQGHDPGSEVHYRNIAVQLLP